MRLPVAAKIALQSAGMTGGSAGSPRPVGGLSVMRKCTSTGGAWSIRSGLHAVEIGLHDAAAFDA